MTTEVLYYCIDIAKSKSFTKTAEKNHISQQAMSQQIKNLEWELGIQLFVRSNRSVKVTAAGEALLGEAEVILRQLEGAIEAAKAFACGKNGSLSLGYNGPSSFKYLTQVIEIFNKRYPDIDIQLETGSNSEILDKFYADIYDVIAIGDFEEFNLDTYDVMEWKSGKVCAVVGKGHPFAQLGSVAREKLAEDVYVSLDFRNNMPMFFRSMERCKRLMGTLPRNVKFMDSTETIDLVVASGVGFTLLNSDLRDSYKPDRLVFVDIDGCEVVHASRFVWKKDNCSPILAAFIKTAYSLELAATNKAAGNPANPENKA